MDGPPTTTTAPTTTKASMTKEILVSDTLSFTAWKESGLTRDQALADCQSRGQRLANIYNESEQAGINALIIDIDGTNRAFWLGMIEDGETPDKNGIKVCSYPRILKFPMTVIGFGWYSLGLLRRMAI